MAVNKARALLIPCETDQYFRPYVSERKPQFLQTPWVDIFPSLCGHLAGSGASRPGHRSCKRSVNVAGQIHLVEARWLWNQ
jgi:hypothetical protein